MATPTTTTKHEVDGVSIEVPKRFGSQESLASYAGELDDKQFDVLLAVLKDRRWTTEEIDERVKPLRPKHSAFTK